MKKIYTMFVVITIMLLINGCGIPESGTRNLDGFNRMVRPLKVVKKISIKRDHYSNDYLLVSNKHGKLFKVSDDSLFQLLKENDIIDKRGIRRGEVYILDTNQIK